MATETLPAVIANRYRLLNKIGQGGMGAVYRAEDLLVGDFVALKRVELAVEHLRMVQSQAYNRTIQQTLRLAPGMDANQIALMNEFRILASLRHPNIVSVLDYGLEDGRTPFFTMEILRGPRDISVATFTMQSFADKVRLLLDLLQALLYLHRHRIVHADLKPSNVLVDADSRVRVLDFGLAVQASYARAAAGSVPYMAPEVLQGEPVTEAADLYAFGLIAYECITGSYPFDYSDQKRLIDEVLFKAPDLHLVADKANAAIASLIERLLAKRPTERFQDAFAVVEALCAAAAMPVPMDNPIVRESFLQSALFVGRQDHLTLLEDALAGAMHGQGSAWLIGGEAGVGKSRLLEELRVRALVNGIAVLRGQGIREGALPMQIWRDVLPLLLLNIEIEPHEASILKPIIPSIGDLLKKEVPDAPDLESPAAHDRLSALIGALFQRTTKPLVLLLDDLHWDEKNLAALRFLLQVIGDCPILVVGTYRSDDFPHFSEQLPQMMPMMLERLTGDEVAELSAAILGDAGRHPQMVSLLQQETEGNALYLVEVLRTLAEEVGTLNLVGVTTLPKRVFPASIREAITRRLSRLPEEYRQVLRFAAVAGRNLDLPLLQHISPLTKYEDWLSRCADSAIIEIVHGTWRFTHDRIRDGILLSTDHSLLPFLHWRVAEAKEALYQHVDQQSATMLDHWRIADNPQRIAHYALIEGQILISHDDFVRARQLLLTAFRRLDNIQATWADPYRLRLYLRVADTYLGTEQPLEARQWYADALMLARRLKEVHATADALVGMARANSAEQQHDSYVRRLFLEAIHLYDSINVPHSLTAALWALGVLSLDQFRLDEARSSFERCLRIFYEQRDQQGVGLVLGRLGYVAFHERRFDLAYQCLQEAILIAQHIGNRFALAQHLNNLALVYREWGETARMIECYQGALAIAEAIGNEGLAGVSLSNLAFAASEEQRVEEAGRLYAEALKVLRRSGKPDKLASALANVALFNIKREQWEGADALLLEWTAIVRTVGAYATIHGLMGWVLWLAHHGQHVQAAEWLGMYLANKRTGFDDHHDVEYCRKQCGASLGDAEMEAAIERGKTLPLERELKHIQTRFRHGDDAVTTEE